TGLGELVFVRRSHRPAIALFAVAWPPSISLVMLLLPDADEYKRCPLSRLAQVARKMDRPPSTDRYGSGAS
ncbi:hypothetical protein C8R46DRAFT_1124350, partial [Mycena filopes]